jgi:hypothetical protein
MEQLQLKPSRENNILDLFLTNQPSIVKSCNTIPGISDHNIIIVDTDLEPRYNKSKRSGRMRGGQDRSPNQSDIFVVF